MVNKFPLFTEVEAYDAFEVAGERLDENQDIEAIKRGFRAAFKAVVPDSLKEDFAKLLDIDDILDSPGLDKLLSTCDSEFFKEKIPGALRKDLKLFFPRVKKLIEWLRKNYPEISDEFCLKLESKFPESKDAEECSEEDMISWLSKGGHLRLNSEQLKTKLATDKLFRVRFIDGLDRIVMNKETVLLKLLVLLGNEVMEKMPRDRNNPEGRKLFESLEIEKLKKRRNKTHFESGVSAHAAALKDWAISAELGTSEEPDDRKNWRVSDGFEGARINCFPAAWLIAHGMEKLVGEGVLYVRVDESPAAESISHLAVFVYRDKVKERSVLVDPGYTSNESSGYIMGAAFSDYAQEFGDGTRTYVEWPLEGRKVPIPQVLMLPLHGYIVEPMTLLSSYISLFTAFENSDDEDMFYLFLRLSLSIFPRNPEALQHLAAKLKPVDPEKCKKVLIFTLEHVHQNHIPSMLLLLDMLEENDPLYIKYRDILLETKVTHRKVDMEEVRRVLKSK